MKISQGHIDALQGFGYTEREARFLYLVGTHSGYFTQRQFMTLLGYNSDRATHTFVTKALARQQIRAQIFQNNARIYHLFSRKVYRAMGKENIRNRREHSLEFTKTRLAILDFVLAHGEPDYLETETEKVRFFRERFNVGIQFMPNRVYKGANRTPHTPRYFVDKFPMFVTPSPSLSPPVMVTFTYIDPGSGSLAGFGIHLTAYRQFLQSLVHFNFIYASPNSQGFSQAAQYFARVTQSPFPYDLVHLLGFFRLRAKQGDGRYGVLSWEEKEFLKRAGQMYPSEPFDYLYLVWQKGEVTNQELSPLIKVYYTKREVQFETYLLARNYSSFGQNAWFYAKRGGEAQGVSLSRECSRTVLSGSETR